MPGRSKSIISILFVMLIWGSSFAITKKSVTEIPPVCFAFLRFAVASAVLLVLYIARRKKQAAALHVPFSYLFWMGLCGIGLYYLFFNYSLVYTSASMGALIQAFIPVIIAVLASLFLNEKPTALQTAGIIISVIGVALVGLFAQASSRSPHPLLGNLLMVAAVIAWAIYTIISKKVSHADVLQVTCFSTLIGTVLLLPAVAVELWHKPLPVISFWGWVSVIYLGVLASALSYFLYNSALKNLPASLVGIFINFDPIIGAGLAVLFLKEQVSILQIAGTILVLLGVWLSTTKNNIQLKPGKNRKELANEK